MAQEAEYDNGYCDQNGNFLGYNAFMTLIPDLIPARRDRKTGRVTYTGNPRTLPKGGVLLTESTGRPGQERVIDGMIEDKGADTAPRGSIPGSKVMSDEAFAEELARRQQVAPSLPDPKDTAPDTPDYMPEESEALQARIAARRGKYAKDKGESGSANTKSDDAKATNENTDASADSRSASK